MTGLAYKVQIMDDGRRLVYVRLYSGTMNVGEALANPTRGIREKPSRIFEMHANHRKRIQKASAGQIVGVLGLKKTYTGDTICAVNAPLLLDSVDAYEPVISQTVEPEVLRDREKLLDVLGKLAEEDPTFRWEDNEETGDLLISGMGELHLEIIASRLKREFPWCQSGGAAASRSDGDRHRCGERRRRSSNENKTTKQYMEQSRYVLRLATKGADPFHKRDG